MFYRERGEGPTLVALHPATVGGDALAWFTRLAVEEGFNVVTPDQRGHGETANPAPDLALTRLVDDYVEFLFQLGRGPVHGFGYSLGGAVSLYAARRKPDLFRSLVILAANYRAAMPERVALLAGPEDSRSGVVKAVFDPQNGILEGWTADLADFKSVTVPTLIIAADRDELNDPEDALALYRAFPNARLLVVPGAGHYDLINHPLVTAGMRGFYQGLSR
jgi:pimeloyl-ACP methyl ester carboxylesterase